ncbi:f-box-like domain-containing protein [Ditylenchus destructor]|nr:f-box-like domain-containing protein [Ditylenchus destructor]
MDAISNINELPVVNLAQIFEKLPQQDRLNIEQVCKKWQHVGKNLSWSNYRIFDNLSGPDWPDTRAMQIKPFFERCGRYLRHLTLRRWFPETVLSFIKMAPNVQHLQLWSVKLNNESLTELAEIVPGLKSLAVAASCQISEHSVLDYTLGLTDCFKVMTSLEYLLIYEPCLFSQHTFVQFPSNLKYLDLCYASNAAQILSWVAEGCKNLKGLLLESSDRVARTPNGHIECNGNCKLDINKEGKPAAIAARVDFGQNPGLCAPVTQNSLIGSGWVIAHFAWHIKSYHMPGTKSSSV